MKIKKEVTINYRKSGLYIIEFDNGIKFGISKNIHSRFYSQYNKPWVREFKQVKVFAHNKPEQIELQLKRYFKHSIKEGSSEFLYNISFDEVIYFIYNHYRFKEHSIIGPPKSKADIINALWEMNLS